MASVICFSWFANPAKNTQDNDVIVKEAKPVRPRTTPEDVKAWLVPTKPVEEAKFRMLCFPWAGGSASLFKEWALEDVEVLAVELPGRGSRAAEPAYKDVNRIVNRLVEVLGFAGHLKASSLPLLLVGSGFGSVVASALAHALRKTEAPLHYLVVAGCPPPSASEKSPLAEKTDIEILDFLANRAGVIPSAEPEGESERIALAKAVPAARADALALSAFAPSETQEPLSCPLLALSGDKDADAPLAKMVGWAAETTGLFSFKIFPGEGSFLKDNTPEVLKLLQSMATKGN